MSRTHTQQISDRQTFGVEGISQAVGRNDTVADVNEDKSSCSCLEGNAVLSILPEVYLIALFVAFSNLYWCSAWAHTAVKTGNTDLQLPKLFKKPMFTKPKLRMCPTRISSSQGWGPISQIPSTEAKGCPQKEWGIYLHFVVLNPSEPSSIYK